jgi:hypothetical protein
MIWNNGKIENWCFPTAQYSNIPALHVSNLKTYTQTELIKITENIN